MAWTFLPNTAQFFLLKNWCKITSRKKSFLTSKRARAGQGVKLPFLSKKCIFWAEKGIFSKRSFYTKMFSDPKYSLSVCQKYFFVVSKKVNIFHQIQPKHEYEPFNIQHVNCTCRPGSCWRPPPRPRPS